MKAVKNYRIQFQDERERIIITSALDNSIELLDFLRKSRSGLSKKNTKQVVDDLKTICKALKNPIAIEHELTDYEMTLLYSALDQGLQYYELAVEDGALDYSDEVRAITEFGNIVISSWIMYFQQNNFELIGLIDCDSILNCKLKKDFDLNIFAIAEQLEKNDKLEAEASFKPYLRPVY